MQGSTYHTAGRLKPTASLLAWLNPVGEIWFVVVIVAAAVVNLVSAIYRFSVRRQSLLAMIAGVGLSLVTIYYVLRFIGRVARGQM